MSHTEIESKITMACPSGHRVRGGAEMVGRTVRCPKCQAQFVFAPRPARTARKPEAGNVTDTGVMRILGEFTDTPVAMGSVEVVHRPCTRCGVAIPESLTVCSHCHCYVGVMPSFMKQLAENTPQRN